MVLLPEIISVFNSLEYKINFTQNVRYLAWGSNADDLNLNNFVICHLNTCLPWNIYMLHHKTVAFTRRLQKENP